jgi:hypothetical protein
MTRPATVGGDAAVAADPYWLENEAAHAGEMRVNSSGDPGRDDYGLPPVDIEVPDDARELDRDVQAYRRELRSQRRRTLARKLAGPLTRDGMVLPLLAGCLALTLLAATLLTVFTVGQGVDSGPLGRPGASRSAPAPAVPGGTAAALTPAPPKGLLPDAYVMADGVGEPLRELIGPVLVLALIPQGCNCFNDLRQLTVEAEKGGALVYLVGMRNADVSSLPRRLDLGASQALEDIQGSFPRSYYGPRLSAVLVRKDGSVAGFVYDRGHGFQITQAVRMLISAHSEGSPSPVASATS